MGVDYYSCKSCGRVRHMDFITSCEKCDERVCNDCEILMTRSAFGRSHKKDEAATYDKAVKRELKGKPPLAKKPKTVDPTKPNPCACCDKMTEPSGVREAMADLAEWICDDCYSYEKGEENASYCPECMDPPPEETNVTEEELVAFLHPKAGFATVDAAKRACRRQRAVDDIERNKKHCDMCNKEVKKSYGKPHWMLTHVCKACAKECTEDEEACTSAKHPEYSGPCKGNGKLTQEDTDAEEECCKACREAPDEPCPFIDQATTDIRPDVEAILNGIPGIVSFGVRVADHPRRIRVTFDKKAPFGLTLHAITSAIPGSHHGHFDIEVGEPGTLQLQTATGTAAPTEAASKKRKH